MTGAPAHGPEPAEDWLTARHRDLRDGLDQFLDPAAGLHEITVLHAGHADLLGALDDSLDTSAGLAAILPTPAEAAPQTSPDTAAAIAAADPAIRVALRRSPVILAVILSDLAVRALIANEAFTVGVIDHDFDHDLVRDLDVARNLDVTRAIGLDIALGSTSNRASNRARRRDLDRAHTRQLAHHLALVLAITLEHSRNDARSLDLGLDLDLDSVILAGGLTPDLDRARDIAYQTAMAVGRALGVEQVEGLAAALLEGALDDFTRADLAHADLTGRDLTGVRWSDWGTRWPEGTDIDRLRTRSREVAHGTGIYVIDNPDDNDKALHNALS